MEPVNRCALTFRPLDALPLLDLRHNDLEDKQDLDVTCERAEAQHGVIKCVATGGLPAGLLW